MRLRCVIGLILGLTGCLSPRTFSNRTVDATADPSWWGQLAKGEVLQLNRDALLGGGGLNLGAWIVTGANGAGEKVSVEQYKAEPSRYARWSLHLLSKGTRLRCVSIKMFFSFEYSAYKVYAEVRDVEYQGTLTSIPVIGDPNTKGALRLNAQFLEPVK